MEGGLDLVVVMEHVLAVASSDRRPWRLQALHGGDQVDQVDGAHSQEQLSEEGHSCAVAMKW